MKKYTSAWEDWSGNFCLLSIYDTQSDTYEVISLTPSTTPFVTKMSDESDPLTPIRTGSAEIGLIGNCSLLSMFDLTSSNRYRIIFKKGDDVMWLGWLKAEALTSDYTEGINEIRLSCIDDLEALKTFVMLQHDATVNGVSVSGSNMGHVVINFILNEIFAHINNVVGDDVHSYSYDSPYLVPCSITAFRTLQLPRRIFFEENSNADEPNADLYSPMSCYDALAIICTAAGCTASVFGTKIYLRRTGSATTGTDLPDERGSHELTEEQGSQRVVVTVNKNVVDSNLIKFDENHLNLHGIYNANAKDYRRIRSAVALYTADKYFKGGFNTVAYWYDSNNVLQTYVVPYDPLDSYFSNMYDTGRVPGYDPNTCSPLGWGAASFAKADSDSHDIDLEEKRNFDFQSGILAQFVCTYHHHGYAYPHFPDSIKIPIITMRSYEPIHFPNGCLELKCDFKQIVQLQEDGPKWEGDESVRVSLKIGNKWWNGKSWTMSTLPVIVKIDKDGESKLKDIKTLDMPYNGASGYIVPIPGQGIRGMLELSLYLPSDDETVLHYLLKDISVTYHNVDDNGFGTVRDHYKYIRTFEKFSDNEHTVDVNIHEYLDTDLCKETLCNVGEFVKDIEGKKIGEALLDTHSQFFGRKRRYIRVSTDFSENINPGTYINQNGRKWAILSASVDWRTLKAVYQFVDI